MPFELENIQKEWMSWEDAAKYIREIEGCHLAEAKTYLRNAVLSDKVDADYDNPLVLVSTPFRERIKLRLSVPLAAVFGTLDALTGTLSGWKVKVSRSDVEHWSKIANLPPSGQGKPQRAESYITDPVELFKKRAEFISLMNDHKSKTGRYLPRCAVRSWAKKARVRRKISPQLHIALQFIRNAEVRDCGLVGRFLFLSFPSVSGSRLVGVPAIPKEASEYWAKLINALHMIPSPRQGEPRLSLMSSYEAEQAFLEFARLAEFELNPGRSLSFDKSWGSKLPGKTLRLAGLLHCIAIAEPLLDSPVDAATIKKALEAPIDVGTMRQAIAMSHVFVRHAQRLFFEADYGASTDVARKIEDWAYRSGWEGFTVDQARIALSRYSTKEVHTGIDLLRQLGRIHEDLSAYQQHQQPGRRGRNFAPRYRLAHQFGSIQG